MEKDAIILQQKEKLSLGQMVKLPDNSTLQAHIKGITPLSKDLSDNAKSAHVFKGLTNSSLFSIGQLCDNGCTAVFDWKHLKKHKNNKLIILGT